MHLPCVSTCGFKISVPARCFLNSGGLELGEPFATRSGNLGLLHAFAVFITREWRC